VIAGYPPLRGEISIFRAATAIFCIVLCQNESKAKPQRQQLLLGDERLGHFYVRINLHFFLERVLIAPHYSADACNPILFLR
jgi:hypothetical protein